MCFDYFDRSKLRLPGTIYQQVLPKLGSGSRTWYITVCFSLLAKTVVANANQLLDELRENKGSLEVLMLFVIIYSSSLIASFLAGKITNKIMFGDQNL